MDFVTGLPKTSRGYDSILVFVDKLSKRAILAPAHVEDDAKATADVYIREVFRHHGLPRQFVSDRDTKFTSKFWQHLQERLGVSLLMSTANHPQTDGQTERMNHTIADMLRCLVCFDQSNWDELLPLVEFAYNNSVNSSTGETPFFVDTGRHPRLPQDLLTEQPLDTPNESANDFAERMANITQLTRDTLQYVQDRQAKYYNEGRRNLLFNPGDQVLVDIAYLETAAERARPKNKLKFRRSGPYPIVERINSHTYKVQLPDNVRAHDVFNVAALTLYKPNTIPGRLPPPLPPVEQPDGSVEYEVESILAHRYQGRGLQYYVKWKGYSIHEATWEKRSQFMQNGRVTNEQLLAYERQHGLPHLRAQR